MPTTPISNPATTRRSPTRNVTSPRPNSSPRLRAPRQRIVTVLPRTAAAPEPTVTSSTFNPFGTAASASAHAGTALHLDDPPSIPWPVCCTTGLGVFLHQEDELWPWLVRSPPGPERDPDAPRHVGRQHG